MSYVVTGVTGHIGNNLVKKLIEQGEEVVLLTRRIDDSIKDLNAKYVVGNLLDYDFLSSCINENDTVIHLAGVIDIKNKQKELTMRVNYEGTKTILDASINNKAKRFIYFSSVDCLEKTKEIFEPTTIDPSIFKDSYSHSKALATLYVMEKRKEQHETIINIVYPSAVIGVNDFKPSSIGKVIIDIIKGKTQFGIKGGYNFVDVEDVVLATINICRLNKTKDYLLTGKNISVYELYYITNKHLNRNKKTIHIPLFLVYCFMPFIPYLSKFVLKKLNENPNYNNSLMKNELGVNPISFEETIEKTINFMKEHFI